MLYISRCCSRIALIVYFVMSWEGVVALSRPSVHIRAPPSSQCSLGTSSLGQYGELLRCRVGMSRKRYVHGRSSTLRTQKPLWCMESMQHAWCGWSKATPTQVHDRTSSYPILHTLPTGFLDCSSWLSSAPRNIISESCCEAFQHLFRGACSREITTRTSRSTPRFGAPGKSRPLPPFIRFVLKRPVCGMLGKLTLLGCETTGATSEGCHVGGNTSYASLYLGQPPAQSDRPRYKEWRATSVSALQMVPIFTGDTSDIFKIREPRYCLSASTLPTRGRTGTGTSHIQTPEATPVSQEAFH